jgi:hypothetical protein
MLDAMRRASSRVSKLAAVRRPAYVSRTLPIPPSTGTFSKSAYQGVERQAITEEEEAKRLAQRLARMSNSLLPGFDPRDGALTVLAHRTEDGGPALAEPGGDGQGLGALRRSSGNCFGLLNRRVLKQ